MRNLETLYKYENKDWQINLVNKIIELDKNAPIILYGAAMFGRNVLKILSKYGLSIPNFCDDNKKILNTKVMGIEVISLKEIKEKYGLNTNIIFCSASTSSINKMRMNCEELSFHNVFYYPEFTIDYTNIFLLKEHENKIASLYNSLADDKSKQILENILKIRLQGNYGKNNILLDTKDDEQYFPNDIYNISEKEIFLDGGGYFGDTIEIFLNKSKNNYSKIYSFEIDESNYNILNQKVISLCKDGFYTSEIHLNKVGLYDKNDVLNFNGNIDGNCCIDSDGTSQIRVVTIDNFFKDKEKPTFIKMDIEGAELNALFGAKETIVTYKPKIAVCIYHEPEHLWEIPLYLKSLVPQYRIYIRNYALNLEEIVCYAVV